jgi:hypothetical protein
MKKTTLVLIITNIILALCIPVSASVGYYMNKAEYPIIVDGKQMQNTDAYVMNGTTYLPIRKVSEMMGCKIEWDSIDNKVIFQNRITKKEITTIVDEKDITKYIAYTIDYKTYLPIDVFRGSLNNFQMSYDIIKITNTLKKYPSFINDVEYNDEKNKSIKLNDIVYVPIDALWKLKNLDVSFFIDDKVVIKSK